MVPTISHNAMFIGLQSGRERSLHGTGDRWCDGLKVVDSALLGEFL